MSRPVKCLLQEYFQKISEPLPEYITCMNGGTSNQPMWECTVQLCNGNSYTAQGYGKKVDVESTAAQKAYDDISSGGYGFNQTKWVSHVENTEYVIDMNLYNESGIELANILKDCRLPYNVYITFISVSGRECDEIKAIKFPERVKVVELNYCTSYSVDAAIAMLTSNSHRKYVIFSSSLFMETFVKTSEQFCIRRKIICNTKEDLYRLLFINS